MPAQFSPRVFQRVTDEGFQRLRHYRSARMMFLRQFVGKYFAASKGEIGDEPINLMFSAIRAMVPHLVMQNPINRITTDYTEQEDYAFLLGRGIDTTEKRVHFDRTLRAGLVSSYFGMGLFKTGISASGQALYIDDVCVDPGAIYIDLVDLDNLTIDPVCTQWEDAAFIGDKIRVPRHILLDSDGYDHDIVAAMPRCNGLGSDEGGSKSLSQKRGATSYMEEAMDYVDVVEAWVPKAEAIICVPDYKSLSSDKFLSIREYYGPKEGPYTRLSLSLPVPNNPLPVAPVSLWFDLHKMANRIFTKTMTQADRQKDITIFDPAVVDQAEDMREARDGEMVAGDPDKVKVVSYGGQNQKNDAMLQQLQIWFNYIAGNPDQIGGMNSNAESATQANILSGNANVGLADSENMVIDCAAEIGGKVGWYLHTDPFIELPIALRTTGGEAKQVILTPEMRRGDFYWLTFTVKPRSMKRLEAQVRAQRLIQFATNVVPAATMAAQAAMQVGQQFNLPLYLSRVADELDIFDDVQDIFIDPTFEERIQRLAQMGPKADGNSGKGKPASGSGTSGLSLPGVMQNGGMPMQSSVPTGGQQFNMNAQMGANMGQQNMRMGQ